jgi:hypothetical protein
MKKIADYIHKDQPGQIAFTGPGVKKYEDPAGNMTAKEKKEWSMGMLTSYPFRFLEFYYMWLSEGNPNPKKYEDFQKAELPGITAQVAKVFDAWYDEKSREEYEDKVKAKIPLYIDIPFEVLGKFHKWLYTGTKEYKDFADFERQTKPGLASFLGDVVLKAYYDKANPLPISAKTEIMLYFTTEYPHVLIRKYYTWLFGEDMTSIPRPPAN